MKTNNPSIDTNISDPYKDEYPNGFYLLSPDGFTLTRDASPYTSIEGARKDFEKWMKTLEHQGYYSFCFFGRIELEELWDFIIIYGKPFYPLKKGAIPLYRQRE